MKYMKIKGAGRVACTGEIISAHKLVGGKSEETNWDIWDLDSLQY